MSFLPNDYTAPSTSSENYMKINKGENRIRILSAPILGFEEWVDKKPLRYRMGEEPMKPKDPDGILRHFWSFICWNYSEERIQILNLTQATLRKKLENLSKDADWGAPYDYDIKIIKEGEDKLTKYDVNPIPKKTVRQDVINAFHAKPCYLEALFESLDPFASGWPSYTKGIFSSGEEVKLVEAKSTPSIKAIEDHEIAEMEGWFLLCEENYREEVMMRLYNKFKYTELNQMTRPIFEILKIEALNKKKEYALKKQEEQKKKDKEDVGF